MASNMAATWPCQYCLVKPYCDSRSQLWPVRCSRSARKRVSGPQLMFGCESRIRRISVVPERWHPTTKIGGWRLEGMSRFLSGASGAHPRRELGRQLGGGLGRHPHAAVAAAAELDAGLVGAVVVGAAGGQQAVTPDRVEPVALGVPVVLAVPHLQPVDAARDGLGDHP